MNKALEQKLIGPMEESHTKEQSPKQFCERCFEQGDRKWQQNELEHGFEQWWDFFLEEEGVCGGWNKWRGATVGPRGRGRTLHPRGQVAAPPMVIFAQ